MSIRPLYYVYLHFLPDVRIRMKHYVNNNICGHVFAFRRLRCHGPLREQSPARSKPTGMHRHYHITEIITITT